MAVKRVCVIGSGAAGLSAARHLGQAPPGAGGVGLDVTVFEQTAHVGGTWVYVPQVGKDHFGNPIHSSMYESMKTNLPKEVMAFPDFPFKDVNESFLHHTKVRQYLDDYCDHFKLRDLIKFETRVDHVVPVPRGSRPLDTKWNVTVLDLKKNNSIQELFDFVVVCNGHYAVPQIPTIPGMDQFKGTVIHSHDYRNPDMFRGKVVAVLGAGASGMDISIEVAGSAQQVFLCHNRSPLQSKMPPNLKQVSGIVSFASDKGFELQDGSRMQADILLLCTGYHFNFPFLGKDCGISTSEPGRVHTLYKHVVNVKHPSMAFIGVPVKVCPFPQFNLQSQWIKSIFSGTYQLPTQTDMIQATTDEEAQQRVEGVAPRHFHVMGERQWNYNRDLAHMAKVPEIPMTVEKLYNDVHATRVRNLITYKRNCFAKGQDGWFHVNGSDLTDAS